MRHAAPSLISVALAINELRHVSGVPLESGTVAQTNTILHSLAKAEQPVGDTMSPLSRLVGLLLADTSQSGFTVCSPFIRVFRPIVSIPLATLSASSDVAISVPNARDLGGIPCSGGREVRRGLILRSATPANATLEDVTYLQESVGLKSVIDLRNHSEADKDVGERRLAANIDHKYISLLEEAMLFDIVKKILYRLPVTFAQVVGLGLLRKLPSRTGRFRERITSAFNAKLAPLLDRLSLSDVYWCIMENRGDNVRRVLELCASPEATPLLLHCTHGKDRTGLISALVLHTCGASRDKIIDDYCASNDWGCSVEGRFLMEQMMPNRFAGLFQLDPWCEAPPEEIERLFDTVEGKYGSVEAYLDAIGFGEQEREQLRERLTQEVL